MLPLILNPVLGTMQIVLLCHSNHALFQQLPCLPVIAPICPNVVFGNNDNYVALEVLDRICKELDCPIETVVEIKKDPDA